MRIESRQLSFDTYEKIAHSTMSEEGKADPLLNAALGFAGEGGEFADQIKKIRFHGHQYAPEMRAKLIKEVGDILWYCAQAALGLGTTLENIAKTNNEKLLVRYPEKRFSVERSVNKTDG